MQFVYELKHDSIIFLFASKGVFSLIKGICTSQDPTMLLIYPKLGLRYVALL